MSPLPLRRYRADRLLREEFESLRKRVTASVGARLRGQGIQLDGADLEACYAQAWQGLYAAITAGEEIENRGAWLTLVTYRRAIDEARGARAKEAPHEEAAAAAAAEPDLPAEIDNKMKLRQVFEGLRGKLNARECEAASLCYVQGLTRAEAAAQMGISEARMVKLMEGRGPGRQGVAGKVGQIVEAIGGGKWCDEQASMMRGLAFGILDPRGERYRLARLHQRECPACRAYVLTLKGLAAALPPLPIPGGFGAPTGHAAPNHGPAAPHAHAAAAGAGAKTGAGTGAAGAGTVSATGAAGAGGAGGGWLAGGSLGAKLAVSCVVALSLGCVALVATPHHAGAHRRHGAIAAEASRVGQRPTGSTAEGPVGRPGGTSPTAGAEATGRAAARQAEREFGIEQFGGTGRAAPVVASARARTASRVRASEPNGEPNAEPASEPAASGSPAGEHAALSAPAGPPTRAEREFGLQ
jgi:DNA-directed RNA polymerase specialized sigma24 family protein